MNVELLEKVKQHILEEPKRLMMGDWLMQVEPGHPETPACGTIGCIAGWACVLSNPGQPIHRLYRDADNPDINHLGLDEEQSGRLFHTPNWPNEFNERYYDASRDRPERARITAARIDHFIKTEGAE